MIELTRAPEPPTGQGWSYLRTASCRKGLALLETESARIVRRTCTGLSNSGCGANRLARCIVWNGTDRHRRRAYLLHISGMRCMSILRLASRGTAVSPVHICAAATVEDDVPYSRRFLWRERDILARDEVGSDVDFASADGLQPRTVRAFCEFLLVEGCRGCRGTHGRCAGVKHVAVRRGRGWAGETRPGAGDD